MPIATSPALLLCLCSLAAADWPGFNGPGHLGDAGSATPIIADLAQGKRLWVSEDRIPDGRCADGTDKEHPTLTGGYGSPVIAGGLVVLGYHVPAGDAFFDAIHQRAGGPREKWSVLSADVVHAFDLRTGKTAWRTVCPELGLYESKHNKGFGGLTPVVAGDRVYAMGKSGRMHCLGLARGEVLWTTPVQPKAPHVDAAKTAWIAAAKQGSLEALSKVDVPLPDIAKGMFTSNRSFNGFPIIAGGVLVTSDHVQAAFQEAGGKLMPVTGLVGLDPATGRQLWRVPDCASSRFTGPLPAIIDGRTCVISVDAYGSALIDPADGRVLWRDPAINQSMGLPIVWRDIVAVQADDGAEVDAEAKARRESGGSGGKRKRPTMWRGFRLTAAKAEPLWSGPAAGGGFVVAPVRDGIAYPVEGDGKNAALWALDLATGQRSAVAKQGTAGGEHDNMFSLLLGDRVLACIGGNQGPTFAERDGYQLFAIAAGKRGLAPTGAPLRGAFAWGYCATIMPAVADGILVYRGNDRLVAIDLRAR